MTAAEAVKAATDVVRGQAMTIAEILAHQSALMPLTTFFDACGIPHSTGYQEAAKDALPVEVIKFARRRYVRTTDAWEFLGLIPRGNGAAREVESRASTENDNAPGVEPGAPVEQSTSTSTSQ